MHQVGYLQELNRDARSTKHIKYQTIFVYMDFALSLFRHIFISLTR